MSKKIKAGFVFLSLVLVAAMAVSCGGQEIGDGKYDYDYSLVSEVGSDPASLVEGTRAVLLEVYDEGGRVLYGQTTLGWLYSQEQEYVVAPIQLFWLPSSFGGRIPSWDIPGITVKAFLLPDPEREDLWKKEELGEIKFNKELGVAVIERIDSVIETPQAQYTLGKYEDLSLGHVLYQVSQANGRLQLERSSVMGLHTDEQGRNLINAQGTFLFSGFGGLLFAVRDGAFELVGLLCVVEPIQGEQGMVFAHTLDINQIMDYIETNIKGK